MSAMKGSDPAFPIQIGGTQEGTTREICAGTSKLELFSGMAMQGMLSNPTWMRLWPDVARSGPQDMGELAVAYGRGLVRALRKVAPDLDFNAPHGQATPPSETL